MKLSAASVSVIFVALVVGLAIGWGVTHQYLSSASTPTSADNEEQKPLYWVAPMDSNYRRDKPGKSPMGMELIPVFQEQNDDEQEGLGTIRINPDVVNNLGVTTAKVERALLKQEILTVGYVKYDENQLIHIHPRVSGWVETLYVKATGDPVYEGSPLYALYSPDLVGAQDELLLAMNGNSARLIKAAESRLLALHISQEFIDQLKKSRSIKQSITFYSPQDGFVDNLSIREGFYVQPGTTLFSIGSLSQVWVEAEVFERQASLVKEGAPVSMTLDYLPGKIWRGKINYIYPTLDSKTRTVRLRIEFDNPDRDLLPNMFAQVSILTQGGAPTLLIPKEALIRTGIQDRVVLSIGEGRFKSVAVKVGSENQHKVEILEGLEEGDEVVSSAQFLLDSESSKTSDFIRMHHQTESQGVQSAEVEGVINTINSAERIVNISRGPIKKWGRPAATMDFRLLESLEINTYVNGDRVEFTFEIRGANFVVTKMEKRPQAIETGSEN